jgi:hypothetical protein
MQTTRFTRLSGITLAVLLTLIGGQGLVFGDDHGDRPPKCTLATLKGRYLFGGIATLLPPAVPQQTLLAVAGYHVFNGDGTGTDVIFIAPNGAELIVIATTPGYVLVQGPKERHRHRNRNRQGHSRWDP